MKRNEKTLTAYQKKFIAQHAKLKKVVRPREVIIHKGGNLSKGAWVAKAATDAMFVKETFVTEAKKDEIQSTIRHEVIHYYLDNSPTRKKSPEKEHRKCKLAHCKHFARLALEFDTGLHAFTKITEKQLAHRGKLRWKYYCPHCAQQGQTFYWSLPSYKGKKIKKFLCHRCGDSYTVEPRKKFLKGGETLIKIDEGKRTEVLYAKTS